jgi:hypothetical protein
MELRFVLGKYFRPRVLDVVEDKGNELNFGLLARRIRGGHRSATSANGRLDSEIREEITAEDEAQRENNYSSANSESGSHSATGPSVFEI